MDGLLISRSTPILIYGSGEVGSICTQKFILKGYHILAALDKEKEGMNIIPGITTYRLGTEPDFNDYKRGIVVVICLADGMLHKAVAERLYEYGYENLVFLPMNHCIQDSERRLLTQLYNDVLTVSDRLEAGNSVVHNYARYVKPDLSTHNSIIKENGDTCTVWMNSEILFSESLELWKGDKNKIYDKDETKDKPLLTGHHYENLFSYFSLKENNADGYFNGFKEEKTKEEKEKFLQKEEKLYHVLKKEHNKGMDFFIDAAPSVIWNPKRHFNLIGGHHRMLFLLNEGHSLLPVVMSREDFDVWCHLEAYDELTHYILENDVRELYAPVPHPGMLNFPSECQLSAAIKLKAVLHFLIKENLAGFKILDFSRGQGYYARNLSRLNTPSVEYRNESLQTLELVKMIHNVLYINNVKLIQSCLDDIGNIYDVVFIFDKFCKIENIQKKKQIYDKINQITAVYLFWESDCPAEKDKILNCTDFVDYRILHSEYRNGRVWQTCVFIKEVH